MKNKWFTCFLSFAPIVLIIISFVGLFGASGPSSEINPVLGTAYVLLTLVGVIIGWVDIIWFIVLTCRRKDWDVNKKVIWSIVLYLLNFFVFPIYWFLCLRTEE